ncbi:MAG: hypothetical protein QNJ97_09855 [Myxococcota bacterium]|nr:hypothetical protein [Myxococcota bacterium]
MKHFKTVAVIATLVLYVATPTRGDVEIEYGGFIDNDIRIAVDRVEKVGIDRNRTTLGTDLTVDLVPSKLRLVADLRFVWTGFTRDTEFEGLTDLARVSPFYIESQAAYVEVRSLVPGLDVRIGRQIVHFGTADMFNPTNNLNPLDLEDPLNFGKTIANEMVRFDWMADENFVFTGVWVPVFQPTLLPPSARRALGDRMAEFPFVSPDTRIEAERLRNVWLRNPDSYSIDLPSVHAIMPAFSLANSQFAFRVLWTAGLFDMSLSYYQGINSVPVAIKSMSATYPSDETSPSGVPKIGVQTDATLTFPKKQVVGFDFAGQLPFLDDAGFWFEGAFVFPERVEMTFDVTEVAPGSRVIRGETVTQEPFFKYTAGMDYTINEHLFITGQFIHGFIDELGAHNINNYWVGGLDVKLLKERLLLRLFVLGELPHEDDDLTLDDDGDGKVDSPALGATNDGTIASYVVFPQATLKPMDGLALTLGGYFLFGHPESKFAQDAAGASLIFLQANASF